MSAPAQSETGRRGWRSPRGMRSGQWLWLLLGLGTWTMIVAWLLQAADGAVDAGRRRGLRRPAGRRRP